MTNKINQQDILQQLNKKEKTLIENFESHPLFNKITSMGWEEFTDILIQRRFLSLFIVNTYELVIDSLSEKQEEVKKVVREILHEEYPRNGNGVPLLSHRELLFRDLLNLGANREQILTTHETSTTKRIREEGLTIFNQNSGKESFEVNLIAGIRFWSEVMVGIEYRCLWPKISEKLSPNNNTNKKRSEFYYFHIIHDDRRSDIGQEPLIGGLTHAEKLGKHLAKLINSESDLKYCIDIEEKIHDLKYQFYDQFILEKSAKLS